MHAKIKTLYFSYNMHLFLTDLLTDSLRGVSRSGADMLVPTGCRQARKNVTPGKIKVIGVSIYTKCKYPALLVNYQLFSDSYRIGVGACEVGHLLSQ